MMCTTQQIYELLNIHQELCVVIQEENYIYCVKCCDSRLTVDMNLRACIPVRPIFVKTPRWNCKAISCYRHTLWRYRPLVVVGIPCGGIGH